MQMRAFICSVTCCFVFAFLVIHPLLPKAGASYGDEDMQTCTWSACEKEPPGGSDEKDCTPENCNPFVPCSVGYCCCIVESFISYTAHWTVAKQERSHFNDNRVHSKISECWHPPEVVS